MLAGALFSILLKGVTLYFLVILLLLGFGPDDMWKQPVIIVIARKRLKK
jgi:hypothetical protein